MCKTKNLIIEIIAGGESKRTYVVRELPGVPNIPPVTLGAFDSTNKLAQFLDALEIK